MSVGLGFWRGGIWRGRLDGRGWMASRRGQKREERGGEGRGKGGGGGRKMYIEYSHQGGKNSSTRIRSVGL